MLPNVDEVQQLSILRDPRRWLGWGQRKEGWLEVCKRNRPHILSFGPPNQAAVPPSSAEEQRRCRLKSGRFRKLLHFER